MLVSRLGFSWRAVSLGEAAVVVLVVDYRYPFCLRIPVLTVSRVNGSDFTHLGTSFHRKLFNCFLKTVKTGTQMCKI
jgi:hypothetical protein